MSGNLMGQVWALTLTHQEMLVMLALADHGDRDGSGIYPSIARLSWMTGYTRRHIQRLLRTLEDKQLIIPVNAGEGGRGHTTEYVMKVSNGVPKGPYPERDDRRRKGDILDTSPEIKGDILDTSSKNDERATFETTKGDILDTKGDILNNKGRHPDRPNRNRTIIEPEEEPARARTLPPVKKNVVAEPEPEAEAPPVPSPPPTEPLMYHQFQRAYLKRHGQNASSQEIHGAYSQYLYEFDKETAHV